MNEMTLPSRHRIRNSIAGGLRPRALPLGNHRSPPPPPHNIEFLRVGGVETSVSLNPECQSGGRTRGLQLSKQAALTNAPGPAHQLEERL